MTKGIMYTKLQDSQKQFSQVIVYTNHSKSQQVQVLERLATALLV